MQDGVEVLADGDSGACAELVVFTVVVLVDVEGAVIVDGDDEGDVTVIVAAVLGDCADGGCGVDADPDGSGAFVPVLAMAEPVRAVAASPVVVEVLVGGVMADRECRVAGAFAPEEGPVINAFSATPDSGVVVDAEQAAALVCLTL